MSNGNRRDFLQTLAIGSLGAAAAGGTLKAAAAQSADVAQSSGEKKAEWPASVWKPISDRKVRVGIVGYGRCRL
jgi:hypothetical protein